SYFYTVQDENHRPLKTYHHILGKPQADDRLVYEEKDTGRFSGVGKTNSERFIVVSSHDHDTSDNWIIDAARPLDAPKLIEARQTELEYDLEHWNDQFIIKTNADGAEDYKIVSAPMADPGPENWTDLIPPLEGCLS